MINEDHARDDAKKASPAKLKDSSEVGNSYVLPASVPQKQKPCPPSLSLCLARSLSLPLSFSPSFSLTFCLSLCVLLSASGVPEQLQEGAT